VGSYYGFIAYWKFDTRFTRGRALSIIIPTAHAIKLLLYYINPPRNDFLIESAKAANMLVCSGQRRSCGGVVTRLVRIGKNYHRGFLLPPLSWGGKVLPFWRTLFNFIFFAFERIESVGEIGVVGEARRRQHILWGNKREKEAVCLATRSWDENTGITE